MRRCTTSTTTRADTSGWTRNRRRTPRSANSAAISGLAPTTRFPVRQFDQYSEQKFLQVKAHRRAVRTAGKVSTEVDRPWTRKVTDVRNWFMFSASERWREADAEHENYTDSGGKSGGQKEKLAYTILAASLAYQFKLEWGAHPLARTSASS